MNTADDLTRSEGREITVNEDADLQLPFLLPEDGYSSDIIKGIPQGWSNIHPVSRSMRVDQWFSHVLVFILNNTYPDCFRMSYLKVNM